MNPQRRSSSCSSEPLRVWRSYSPPLHSTAHLHLLLAGVAGGTAPPTHLGPTRTRREPTTAQERDSIRPAYHGRAYYRPGVRAYRRAYYRPFVGRAYRPAVARGFYRARVAEPRTRAYYRSEVRRFGTGDRARFRGASRSATPLTGSRTNPLPEPRSLPVRGSHAAPPRFRWTGASAPLALLSSPQLS